MVNLDFNVLVFLIGFIFALPIIGYLFRFQIPISIFFLIAGVFLITIFLMTDRIILDTFTQIDSVSDTQVVLSNTTVISYNVMSGVTNFTLRNDGVASFILTEFATNSSSQLFGDTIQCISYELIRVGNAIPNSNAQFGIFSSNENFVQFFGNISASSISSSSFQYYTVCVPEGQEYTITDSERIGIKYKYGNSTNFLRAREDSSNPFDGTISVRSSMVSTTFANSATRDVNARFWDYDVIFGISQVYDNSLDEKLMDIRFEGEYYQIKVIMIFIAVMFIVGGALVEVKQR